MGTFAPLIRKPAPKSAPEKPKADQAPKQRQQEANEPKRDVRGAPPESALAPGVGRGPLPSGAARSASQPVAAPFAGPRVASRPSVGAVFPTWLQRYQASRRFTSINVGATPGGGAMNASDERQADELGADLGRDLREVASVSSGSLSRDVRDIVERRLGVDLSGTTLHADTDAAAHAQRHGALAITHGTRVDFAAGRLSTSTEGGRALLAHELVHLAQQGAHAGAGRAFGVAAPALAAPSRAIQAKPDPADAGPMVTVEPEGAVDPTGPQVNVEGEVLVKVKGQVVAKGNGFRGDFDVRPVWDPESRSLAIVITLTSDSATMATSPEAETILDAVAVIYELVIQRRLADGGTKQLGDLHSRRGKPSPEAPPARLPTPQEAPPPAAHEKPSRPPPESTTTTTPKRVGAPGTASPAPAPKAEGPSPTPPVPARSVASMSAGEKLAEAALRAGQQLGPEFVEQLKGLFSFQTLVVLVVWAASHAVGLGEAIDAILAAIFGVDVAREFVSFVFTAIDAKSDKDLDKAGHHLAAVVIAVGLPKLGKALGEIGGKALKGGAEAERGAGKTGTAGAKEPAEPKSATEPTPSDPKTSEAAPPEPEAAPSKAPAGAARTGTATTAENAAELARNLAKEKRPVGANQAAGHIVPSTGSRGHWAAGARARALLQRYGIGVNDAANGIPVGHPRPHNTMHTRAFLESVEGRLNAVVRGMQERGFGYKAIRAALRRELRAIGQEMEKAP